MKNILQKTENGKYEFVKRALHRIGLKLVYIDINHGTKGWWLIWENDDPSLDLHEYLGYWFNRHPYSLKHVAGISFHGNKYKSYKIKYWPTIDAIVDDIQHISTFIRNPGNFSKYKLVDNPYYKMSTYEMMIYIDMIGEVVV